MPLHFIEKYNKCVLDFTLDSIFSLKMPSLTVCWPRMRKGAAAYMNLSFTQPLIRKEVTRLGRALTRNDKYCSTFLYTVQKFTFVIGSLASYSLPCLSTIYQRWPCDNRYTSRLYFPLAVKLRHSCI